MLLLCLKLFRAILVHLINSDSPPQALHDLTLTAKATPYVVLLFAGHSFPTQFPQSPSLLDTSGASAFSGNALLIAFHSISVMSSHFHRPCKCLFSVSLSRMTLILCFFVLLTVL